MFAIPQLAAAVSANRSVINSAVLLLGALAAGLREAIAQQDMAKVRELADTLDAQTGTLAAAVAANTVADPVDDPVVDPVVDPVIDPAIDPEHPEA